MSDLGELTKAIGDLGKPWSELGAKLINSLLGKPCSIVGEMLGDELYYWHGQIDLGLRPGLKPSWRVQEAVKGL